MALKEIEVSLGGRILIEVPRINHRILVTVRLGDIQVVSDKCPHRGGPLHLCYVDPENIRRCPWHDRKVFRDEQYDDVCAIYFPKYGVLRLVSTFEEYVPWPTRVITDDFALGGAR